MQDAGASGTAVPAPSLLAAGTRCRVYVLGSREITFAKGRRAELYDAAASYTPPPDPLQE